MQRAHKPGRITLEGLYPVCKYMAAILIAVSYPRFSPQIRFLPGMQLPRAVMMIWVLLLLACANMMDMLDKRAKQKDQQELAEHVRNGGMNRSTLLALGVPALFILNCLAVVHLYYVYLQSGLLTQTAVSFSMGTVTMAVGIVLRIYGAEMHHIRFGSIWGIRTKATLGSQVQWQHTHEKAGLPVRLCGTFVMVAGTFLSDSFALGIAAAACLGAFVCMFRK